MAVIRLEKRPTEVETPKTSEPEHVPPPPLPLVQFPRIPTAPPVVGVYEMPAPSMPVGVLLQRQFVVGETSGIRGPDHHMREQWDVDNFLKNGGSCSMGVLIWTCL